ncbi:MAG: FeoB small GTPase domain-containing protein, partial [Planctomycetota bacterium]
MSEKEKTQREYSDSSQSVKKIAIVGLPNTGKSQVFNNLTGEYALVANYPLTTVEMKRTRCEIGGEPYEVIDTPGLHCLYIHSEEDANQLKQSLTLTADLLELGIPIVISLNAIDETARRGVWIDSDRLSHLLGVPVVESITVDGLGTRELKGAISKARRGKWSLQYGEVIDDGISAIESELPEEMSFKRKVAVLLLLADPFLTDYLREKYGQEKVTQLQKEVNRVRREFKGDFGRAINNKRSQWVAEIAENTTKKQKVTSGEFSKSFGRLSRHPVFGIPILLVVIFMMYFLVVNVANVIAGWMDQILWIPVESKIDTFVTIGWLKDFLIGDYGVLSLGLANAFLTILPILTVFFLAFNILEDVGYIPNLCVLTKRIFDKLGLSGSAIMPLVLGFGCKTMATLTTKSLRSKKERYIAIYLIAFAIPCAAQMALNMSILGRMGIKAFAIAFSTLAFVEIAAGCALNKILKEEDRSDFIQELPAIRL